MSIPPTSAEATMAASRSDRFFETLKQPMLPGTPTRPRLFGILNLTPDSFSDGGAHTASPEAAADFAAQMVADGSLCNIDLQSSFIINYFHTAATQNE